MFGVLMKMRLAWGFSVKVPKEAKAQSAYSIPPPTTLIGAVCRYLAVSQGLGEIVTYEEKRKKKLASAVSRFAPMFRAASAFYEHVQQEKTRSIGKYWEDPLRFQVLQFQKKVRRGEPEYRFNLVPAGKVFFPGGIVVAGLLGSEEEAVKVLGSRWAETLRDACYAVTCLGSKEGIVEVLEVEVMRSVNTKRGEFETRFYQRRDLVKEVEVVQRSAFFGLFGTYVERFWEVGYEWGEHQEQVEYVVPGTRDPVTSCRMIVRPVDNAVVCEVGEDGILVPS
jgi:CRISPR-associated protein Cas5a/b/c